MTACFRLWLSAFRPKTLTAAVVPIFVGTALVHAHDRGILPWVSGCALLAALLIQVATNLINDSIDFKKGADTAERLGPQRLTASGERSAKAVMVAGLMCLVLAFILGIPLVLHGGWPLVAIGIPSLFLAYGYTGGPFPLAYLGLGDLFVILFFGLIAVGGIYFLHTLSWSFDMIVAGLQVGCLATVLIAINNLRDVDQDLKAQKKTLAVRLGKRAVRYEIMVLMTISFVLQAYWWLRGFQIAAMLPLLVWPVAYQVLRGVYSYDPGVIYNRFLAKAAVVHLGFGLMLSLGFWWHDTLLVNL